MRLGSIGNSQSAFKLSSKAFPAWQPVIGQRVMVVGAQNDFDKKFTRKCGTVLKNRGLGMFLIKFDDGHCVSLKSILLRGLGRGRG